MGTVLYVKEGKLGEGSFGKVYKATAPDGNKVAIKRIYYPRAKEFIGIISLKELEYTSFLEHPYIAKSIHVLHEFPFSKLSPKKKYRDDKIYLVSTLATYDCEALIYDRVTPVSHMKRGMYQVLSGLYYLHVHGIMHRDIKPDNILCYYDDDGYVTMKIADLGLAKPYNNQDSHSPDVVCHWYRPPEVILENEEYDISVDIWALGCVFFEMVSRKIMFKPDKKKGKVAQLQEIFRILGSPNEDILKRIANNCIIPQLEQSTGISLLTHMGLTTEELHTFNMPNVDYLDNPGTIDEFVLLIEQMVKVDPRERVTAWNALNHPFFSGTTLGKQQEVTIPSHTLEIYHCPNRTEGIAFLQASIEADWRVIFLCLDMFERLLCIWKDTLHSPRRIIVVLAYLANKYYLGEDTPPIECLLPEKHVYSSLKLSKKLIETVERNILEALNYKVYRKTVYDILPRKALQLDILLEILSSPIVDGHTIETIQHAYLENSNVYI